MTSYKITVPTKLTKAQLQEVLRSVGKIIVGTDPRYAAIRDRFWAIFTQEMFRILRRSYMARSWRRADELGNRWKPIKPSTVKRKSKPHYRNGVRLPPSKFPASYNRDTSDLLDSFKPGTIAGNHYQPVRNQYVRKTSRNIKLGSDIEYAAYALTQDRELFPPGSEKFVAQAISIALVKITPLIAKGGLL